MAGEIDKVESHNKFLWEEYKLLQDKVDKVGAFRYQVKGWLIPLVSAWLAAIYTAHIPTWAYIFAALFPLLFWLLEEHHSRYQDGFIRRILIIEEEIFSRTDLPFFGPRPFVKKEDRAKYAKDPPPLSPAQAIGQTDKALKNSWRGKAVLFAHGLFYWAVAACVIGVTLIAVLSGPANSQSVNTVAITVAPAKGLDVTAKVGLPTAEPLLDMSHTEVIPERDMSRPYLPPSPVPIEPSRQREQASGRSVTEPQQAPKKLSQSAGKTPGQAPSVTHQGPLAPSRPADKVPSQAPITPKQGVDRIDTRGHRRDGGD